MAVEINSEANALQGAGIPRDVEKKILAEKTSRYEKLILMIYSPVNLMNVDL
jgi:hypothetical protein